MTETAAILEKLLPILLLMLTGFVFRQTGFVTQQVMEGMKKLAVNVTLPVIIFLSLNYMRHICRWPCQYFWSAVCF